MGDFSGKTVVVTGAGAGIGRAAALAFAPVSYTHLTLPTTSRV